MKNITPHNCEAWMLDYFEGRLNAKQSAELMAFLELHPEWKAEFDAFGEIEETPEITPENKNNTTELRSSLLQNSRDEDLIALLEGQLSTQDSRQLLKEIERDEQLAGDFAVYQLTRVKPDFSIQYPYKSKLRKSAPVRVMMFRYAAAAALLFGAFVAGWMYFNSATSPVEKTRIADLPAVSNEQTITESETLSPDNKEQDPEQTLPDAQPADSNQITPKVKELDQIVEPARVTHQKVTPPKPEIPVRDEMQIAVINPVGITNISQPEPVVHIEPATNQKGSVPAVPSPEWFSEDESKGLGGLLGSLGQSVLSRLKNVAGENVSIEQNEVPEEELYTSTFKLGTFEFYRSRTKK